MASTRLPLHQWLSEGVRAGFFLRPRIGGAQPSPAQVAALLAIFSIFEVGLGRLEVAGAASFDLRGWLAPWWSTAALLLLAWWALPPPSDSAEAPGLNGIAAWFALWMAAVFPANLVSQLLGIAQAHDALPGLLDTSAWAAWAVYLVLWGWTVAAVLRLSARFGMHRARLAALALGLIALFGLAAWQFPDRPWRADAASQEVRDERPRLELSQEVFEAQQALWQKTIETLAPERAGTVDVYGLVFSPYAQEDVFLRESTLVAKLLAERFDAQDRVIHLANHATTAQTHPWATLANLERAIDALGARMDRDNDVLVVYLTSHGASDFKLAAANDPLSVDPISPGELRQALDKAGIRNRVIAISACFSGGWLGPLAGDSTLVMTAADATHTSYGCGKLSELTFFGRALFDEQLRKTHSFEQAFAAAVPVIQQREVEAGKSDGFSNPQISVGERIRPLLKALEQRLDSVASK
ncbi:MAG: putative rane protein [Ramlibacter sp.]|nr:putative rane protein [Ramlibacter sp.]